MSSPQIPSWNHVVLVNDFDDGYWDDDFENAYPEAYKALTNLKPKYSQPGMYLEAIKTYNQYIDIAIGFYGGKMAVDYIYELTGSLPKGIVPKPMLNKKGAKRYIAGATYDNGTFVPLLTDEQKKAVVSADNELNINPEDIQFSEEKIPREIRRVVRKGIEEVHARRNARASYKESAALYTTDVVAQVLMNSDSIIDNPYTNLTDIEHQKKRMSLEDHIREYDEFHSHDDDEVVAIDVPIDSVSDRYSYANSVSSAYRQRLANETYILKIMKDAGMKVFTDSQLKNMSPELKSRYKNSDIFEYEDLLTKKERKKYAKKYRKESKKYAKDIAKHRASSDRALANLLSSRSIINIISEEMDPDE